MPKKPHHLIHVFDALIFRETGYTCYRCYEEDAEVHYHYRYVGKRVIMDVCRLPKEQCRLFQAELRNYSKYLRRNPA